MTYLKKVSISGADNNVDFYRLIDLTKRYPFVEWGLLYMPDKEGISRYPTPVWRDTFLLNLSRELKGHPIARQHTAVHLCGNYAHWQLLAGSLPAEIRRYGRVQLNANARETYFSPEQIREIYKAALKQFDQVILQSHEGTQDLIEVFLNEIEQKDFKRVHVLNDQSRGMGIVPDSWYSPYRRFAVFEGFAGGLNPDNLADNLIKLNELGVDYWIDMETGVRTDNKFDLDKVEKILQTCEDVIALT